MKPGNVPTEHLGPIVAELIAERWPQGGGVEVLAEKVGCDYKTVENVVKQTHEGVDFDLADKLLCALGRVDMWRGVLADVYLEMQFVETCALPGCGKTFPEQQIGRAKRYCSKNCGYLGQRVKRGVATGERLRKRGMCLKGHRLTPDNVRITKRGDGVLRTCRTCDRERQREWARAKRARRKVAA